MVPALAPVYSVYAIASIAGEVHMVTAALMLLLVAGADEVGAALVLVAAAVGVSSAAGPPALWHAASSAAVLSRAATAMRCGRTPAAGLMFGSLPVLDGMRQARIRPRSLGRATAPAYPAGPSLPADGAPGAAGRNLRCGRRRERVKARHPEIPPEECA